jgi:hypothetical protein
MLFRPPREKQFVSWIIVAAWTLIIYVTIPLAQTIRKYVAQHWGREIFTYAVLVIILTALAASVYLLIRHRPTSRHSFIWLITVAVIFIGYTLYLGQRSPEEATHFFQYGILGVLVYRALTHKIQDISIYLSGAIICGTIGAVDEAIQWLVSDRHWDLRDIWINFFAGALIQIGIYKGLKPSFIDGRHDKNSLRFLCSCLLAASLVLGASLLNTPKRIAWYTQQVPWLRFIAENGSLMAEYGYLYTDQDIGVFRSRFSKEELKIVDRKRATEAAGILDRYPAKTFYSSFLKIYSPISDPFVHEARVHLYSRDQHINWARENFHDSQEYARHLTIARHENQIMEKYFSETIRQSNFRWSMNKRDFVDKHSLKNMEYESWTSRNLITRFSEGQVSVSFLIIILGLVIAMYRLRR